MRSMQNPSIILYSGTFDPPHLGHLHCIESVAQEFPEATVKVMPTPAPAGASGKHKNPNTSIEHREKMVEMLLEELSPKFRDQVEMDLSEKELPTPNFSNRTLAFMRNSYPKDRFALLMGMDQFESFSRWYKPEEILAQADLLCVHRGEGTAKEKFKAACEEIAATCQINIEQLDEHTMLFVELGHQARLVTPKVVEVSSTELRQGNVSKLPPKIVAYAQEQGLYAEGSK